MRILFLLTVFLMSGKCFAQAQYDYDWIASVTCDTNIHRKWNPVPDIYFPHFSKTVEIDTNIVELKLADKYATNGTFTTQWGKEVTSNYTLTEDDNGSFIYVNATSNVTIPQFKVPFTCTVVRVGTGRVTFTGATWRSGFTPLSSRLQSVTITSLPNRIAIIN